MVIVSLITVMGLLIIEMDLTGIIVKGVMMVEDLEDLVTITLRDHLITEVVVLMVIIALQMAVSNLREVDGLQKMQMIIGMVLRIHLQT